MKNLSMNSRLADFENELENLNRSEMKEVVGGDYGYVSGGGSGGVMTFTCVATTSSVGNFGGYNSFSDFASASGLTSPSSSSSSPSSAGHSGGSSSSAPSTNTEDCIKKYDDTIKAININQSLYIPVNPSVVAAQYNLLRANAARTQATCLR